MVHKESISKIQSSFQVNFLYKKINSAIHIIKWKLNPIFIYWKFIYMVNMGSKKLVVGSSDVTQNGWMASEVKFLDATKYADWDNYFRPNYLSNILAEHVWEHIQLKLSKVALSNCYKYLKKRGRLRIAVPDGFNPSKSYIDHVSPNGPDHNDHGHKVLYNYEILSGLLKSVGFKVKLLEYYDRKGNFHKNNWLIKDGLIHRSAHHDARNNNGKLNYTSLIIDGVK